MKYPYLPLILSRKARALASTFILTLALASSHSALAATNYYWAPTPGVLGGDGTWATSDATNWTTDSAGGGTHDNWNSSTASIGIFNGADGTYSVTLGTTPMNFGGITFNADGYTLSAVSASTLASSLSPSNLTVASGKTVTIGNNVTLSPTGGNGLSLTGGGTVVFASGSTVSTPTRVWIGGQAGPPNTLNTATTVKLETGASMSATVQDLVVNATFLVEGGTASAAGSIFIGQTANTATASNLTISSGSVTANAGVRFGASSNATSHGGTLNLNGGVLTTRKLYQTAAVSGISSTVNFNGGTLKPTATDNSTFLNGLNTAQIRDGGAKIDTDGFDVTIGQALSHSVLGGDNATDGGLAKQGAGVLTISGSNTYTGVTSVQGGTLKLALGASLVSSTLSVSSGAIYDVSALSSYSLSGINTAIGVSSSNAGLLNAGSIALTLGGNLTLNFTSASLTGNSFDLMNFGNEAGNFSSVDLTGSFSGSLFRTADLWTGSAGGYNFSFNQADGVLSFSAIPEPSSYALAVTAFVVLVVANRRRRMMAA